MTYRRYSRIRDKQPNALSPTGARQHVGIGARVFTASTQQQLQCALHNGVVYWLCLPLFLTLSTFLFAELPPRPGTQPRAPHFLRRCESRSERINLISPTHRSTRPAVWLWLVFQGPPAPHTSPPLLAIPSCSLVRRSIGSTLPAARR